MKLKIGFNSVRNNTPDTQPTQPEYQPTIAPRPSVVQVRFPDWTKDLAYYNDRFDLKAGDFVYVDGKLAGKRGRVTQVNYNFKIKRSDYQQVIATADTLLCRQPPGDLRPRDAARRSGPFLVPAPCFGRGRDGQRQRRHLLPPVQPSAYEYPHRRGSAGA